MLFLNLIFLVVVLFLQFFSPFVYLVNLTKHELKASEKFLFSLLLGISINSSIFFLLGIIWGAKVFFVSYFFLIAGIVNYKQSIRLIKDNLTQIKKKWWGLILIVLFSLIFSLTTIFSGFKTGEKIIFQEMHDSMWHISLMENLKEAIPPVHPSSFEVNLTGYHYFYNLFLSSLSINTGLSSQFLYFQISTIFLSLILGLSAYVYGRKIFNTSYAIFLTFMVYFGGSFSYLIPFFIKNNTWHESSFWVSQTFATATNPQLTYSLVILLIVIMLLRIEKKQSDLIFDILISFLIASSIGFKSYGYIVLMLILFFDNFLLFFKTFKITSFKRFFICLLFSLPFLYLLKGVDGMPFYWNPGWFINSMVEAPDRLNYLKWKFEEDTYKFLGNNLAVFRLKVKELLVFYVGNLGIRFLFVFSIWEIIKQKRYDLLKLFLAFIIISAFPLFFLQKGIIWNTIQFWYYALLLANILFVFTINLLIKRTKIKIVRPIIILLIIALAIPTFLHYLNSKLNFGGINQDEFDFFVNNIEQNAKILVCPNDNYYYKTTFLNAYTRSKSLLINLDQLKIVGFDYDGINHEVKRVCEAKDDLGLIELVNKYKIDYVISDNPAFINFINSVNRKGESYTIRNLMIKEI